MSSFNDESFIALVCKKYLLTKQEYFHNNQ